MSVGASAYRFESELARLSPRQRRERGVFYTPWELAVAIVAQVDARLKTDFNLPLGLADSATYRSLGTNAPSIASYQDPDQPAIRILEPSAGSGVFLVALLRQMYQNLSEDHLRSNRSKALRKKTWQRFVEEDLPKRLHAIELLPESVPAARETIGQFFKSTGLSAAHSKFVSLCVGNALEPDVHARLGDSATVIVGNPPYSAASTNRGQWIRDLLRGTIEDQSVYRSYFEADGQPLNERKLWLHDDYVKFLRVSQWHLERSGFGVIGLVTNHGFLDNVTFRGLRSQLADQFDRIDLLDLNGNAKKRGTASRLSRDESVFDIGQGVAISILCQTGRSTEKIFRHGQLWGPREGKLESLSNTPWEQLTPELLTPAPPHYFLAPRQLDVSHEYDQGISITELIPQSTSTIVTARDSIVVDTDPEVLLTRIAEFRDRSISDDELRARYFPRPRSSKYPAGDTRGWKLSAARESLRSDPNWKSRIVPCAYRPFDRRWIYWSAEMIDWPRGKVMQAMQQPDALALIVRRQMPPDRPCNFFLAADALTVDGILRSDNRGNETLLPITIAGQENLNRALLPKHLASVNVREIFAYLYALFHSSEFRAHFAESLRIEYPRVFFPEDTSTFQKLSRLGEALLTVHLATSDPPDKNLAAPTRPIAAGHPKWSDGLVWIDRQTPLAEVDSETWLFHVGSHQVLRKWLKDRRGKELSAEDVANYLGVVSVVGKTQDLIQQIDATMKKLGGLHRALGISQVCGS
ncbi:type ISP restriction/modification enzyme [Blastopirellula marina]|uniref:site-specific DNA-methyltransferase (adenine-specific) n=1 Tax=Blastopirellula marina TaxID=124 RepID=A0A2S8GJ04_9BACT|nr:type ISP restriction/modification enzyme [Blastopirellula marina]PQO44408.1 hypothetical protein C5Y93_18490 [Blastopirellula marina]